MLIQIKALIMNEWSARSAQFASEILEMANFLKSVGIDPQNSQLYADQIVIIHKFCSLTALEDAYEKDPEAIKLMLKSMGLNDKSLDRVIGQLGGTCTIS